MPLTDRDRRRIEVVAAREWVQTDAVIRCAHAGQQPQQQLTSAHAGAVRGWWCRARRTSLAVMREWDCKAEIEALLRVSPHFLSAE